MQPLTAQSYRLPGLDTLPELGIDIRQMPVYYFVLTVTYCLADAMHGVVAHARHDTAGHCRQDMAPHVEVDAVMKKFLTRFRVCLLAVAERQLHIFSLRLLERHTVAAVGMQDHFFCIFHCSVLFCPSIFSFRRPGSAPPERVPMLVPSIHSPAGSCGEHPRCCR